MEGLNKVMHGEPRQEKELRKLADDINVLYTAIKLYLARMPKEELAEEESRRWAEIIEMSLNLEQRRAGGGRVAPLGGDHRNVAQP